MHSTAHSGIGVVKYNGIDSVSCVFISTSLDYTQIHIYAWDYRIRKDQRTFEVGKIDSSVLASSSIPDSQV